VLTKMGTKTGTKMARYEKAHQCGGLKSLIDIVGPHGLETWTNYELLGDAVSSVKKRNLRNVKEA
jgi:hypothetical protein